MFNENYKKESPILGMLGIGGGVGSNLVGGVGDVNAVAIGHNSSPYLTVYKWNNGFGAKYSDPSSAHPGDSCRGVTFTSDNSYIIAASSNSPYINAWNWDNNTGFGSKVSNPSSLPIAGGRFVALNPSETFVAMAGENEGVQLYAWSGSGFGTKKSKPSNNSNADGLAWSPSGNHMAIASRNPSRLEVTYIDSSGNFGTERTVGTSGQCNECAWSPTGNAVGAVHFGGDGQNAYEWTGTSSSADFGSTYTQPSGQTENAWSMTWNRAGNLVAVGHVNSPYVHIWPWTDAGGFGSPFSDPSTTPTGTILGVEFSPDDGYICVAGGGTPYVHAYAVTSSAFGAKVADPSTLPTGFGYAVKFSNVAT